jgi:hypothetical protein
VCWLSVWGILLTRCRIADTPALGPTWSEDHLPSMSTREREVAMTAFYEHRHEGKFQYALHEAVKEVIRFRRTESGSFTNICGVVQPKAAHS